MPERTKLTEKVLREAVPIVGRDYQIFDTEVRGFAACIYRGGGRAFTLDYRHAGRQRRMTGCKRHVVASSWITLS
jgi:hypothetical protein